MAVHASHAALPFPVKGARFSMVIPYVNSSGTATDPTTPDTEVSVDGAAFADCVEEVSVITGSNGQALMTFTGDETNGSVIAIAPKAANASGPPIQLNPPVLRVVHSGTAQAGANGSITLASSADDSSGGAYTGCIVRTTGGTAGGGGSGSRNNQARVISAYNQTTKVATVVPNWETNPDNTTTYEILRPNSVGVVDADIRKLNGVTGDAVLLAANVEGDVVGTVSTSANGAGSSTQLSFSDITEATAQQYIGKQMTVTSGACKSQCWGVLQTSALTNGENLCTFDPGSSTGEVPVAGDKVIFKS